jgi:hypothetical protein
VKHGYKFGEDLFLGKVQSKDDLYFYEGFHNSPLKDVNRERFRALKDMGTLATEMEASILPIYRDLFIERYRGEGKKIRINVGVLLTTLKSPMDMEMLNNVEKRLGLIALDGLYIIHRFREGMETLDDILKLINL